MAFWLAEKNNRCVDCGKAITNGGMRCFKHAKQHSMRLAAMAKHRRPAPDGAVFESIDEYLNRGGSITRVVPTSIPYPGGMPVYHKANVRRGRAAG